MVVTDMKDHEDCFLSSEYIVSVKRAHDDHDRDILIFTMIDGSLVTVDNSAGITLEEVVKRMFDEKLWLRRI